MPAYKKIHSIISPHSAAFKCTFQSICMNLQRAIKIPSDLEINVRLQAEDPQVLIFKPYYVIERMVVSCELPHSAIKMHIASAVSTIDIIILSVSVTEAL